jgi:BCD family chlorophyll transporter-like MFS transporter
MENTSLGWSGILRIGLVQAALGAIVVLTTSTMNRLMVVELALPAAVPGALVGLHYAMQILRPRLGFGSDVGGRRTPWIIGGMGILAIGGIVAALAIALMGSFRYAGIAVAVLAFILIGIGVGAAGTSLLVLLAKRVDERKRPAAATVVWLMMICGFVLTTIIVGACLDPYSPARLVTISAIVGAVAMIITLLAVRNIEGSAKQSANDPAQLTASHRPSTPAREQPAVEAKPASFMTALAEVWAEPKSRRFTIFVFVSMLAYSAQDLILEPFAGAVFGFTPGQSTRLSSALHGGALVGMVMVALACSGIRGRRFGSLPGWTIGGCVASALALLGLVAVGTAGPILPLKPLVFALGIANGSFAVAAIGSMMSFASSGRESREGVRMGMWGAAQALAFGIGGFLGAAASDLARHFLGVDGPAYAIVFAAESAMFLLAAVLASRLDQNRVSVPAVIPAPLGQPAT